MATKTTEKRISVEEQIKQLENQRKQLIQKEKVEERKARNHRLCKRGGIIEKLLPDIINLTDEQFDTFVQKVMLTEQTKRIIATISAQKPIFTPTTQSGDSANRDSVTAEPEPAEAEQISEQANPFAE